MISFLKKFSPLLACVLSFGALQGAPVISLQSSGVSVNPGDSFSVSLTLNNDLPALEIIGYDFFVYSSANLTFNLTGRTYTAPLSTLVTTSGALSLPKAVTMTGLYQNDDATLANLGASDPSETGFGLGLTTLVTLTFTLAPSATLNSTPTLTFYNNGPEFVQGGPGFSDNDFPVPNEYQSSSPLVFTVTVVPEPATSLLLLGGMGTLLAFSRSRRSGRSSL